MCSRFDALPSWGPYATVSPPTSEGEVKVIPVLRSAAGGKRTEDQRL